MPGTRHLPQFLESLRVVLATRLCLALVGARTCLSLPRRGGAHGARLADVRVRGAAEDVQQPRSAVEAQVPVPAVVLQGHPHRPRRKHRRREYRAKPSFLRGPPLGRLPNQNSTRLVQGGGDSDRRLPKTLKATFLFKKKNACANLYFLGRNV